MQKFNIKKDLDQQNGLENKKKIQKKFNSKSNFKKYFLEKKYARIKISFKKNVPKKNSKIS